MLRIGMTGTHNAILLWRLKDMLLYVSLYQARKTAHYLLPTREPRSTMWLASFQGSISPPPALVEWCAPYIDTSQHHSTVSTSTAPQHSFHSKDAPNLRLTYLYLNGLTIQSGGCRSAAFIVSPLGRCHSTSLS